jgi:hypothetical protein
MQPGQACLRRQVRRAHPHTLLSARAQTHTHTHTHTRTHTHTALACAQAIEDKLQESESRARELYDCNTRLEAHVHDLESRKRAPLYQKKQASAPTPPPHPLAPPHPCAG